LQFPSLNRFGFKLYHYQKKQITLLAQGHKNLPREIQEAINLGYSIWLLANGLRGRFLMIFSLLLCFSSTASSDPDKFFVSGAGGTSAFNE